MNTSLTLLVICRTEIKQFDIWMVISRYVPYKYVERVRLL